MKAAALPPGDDVRMAAAEPCAPDEELSGTLEEHIWVEHQVMVEEVDVDLYDDEEA